MPEQQIPPLTPDNKRVPLVNLNRSIIGYATVPKNTHASHVVYRGVVFYHIGYPSDISIREDLRGTEEYVAAVGTMMLDDNGVGTTWTFGWEPIL